MRSVFADTFYFIALLNPNDESHLAADQFAADRALSLVTTAWVLTELADGLASTDAARFFESYSTIWKMIPALSWFLTMRKPGAEASSSMTAGRTRTGRPRIASRSLSWVIAR